MGWCDPPPRPGSPRSVVAVHEQLFEEVAGHCMRRKLGATDPGDRVPWRVFLQPQKRGAEGVDPIGEHRQVALGIVIQHRVGRDGNGGG